MKAFKKPIVSKNYFTIRMPDDLRKQIQTEADKSCRSLSMQIIFMLQQQIEQHNDK
tara:strand:- start:10 stop:177 length:168 start_codon:yes stop_codon:yes gene_type:complete